MTERDMDLSDYYGANKSVRKQYLIICMIMVVAQCTSASAYGPYFFVYNHHGKFNPLPQEGSGADSYRFLIMTDRDMDLSDNYGANKSVRKQYLIICMIMVVAQCTSASAYGPYFFVCNHHGKFNPLPQENEEILLSVTLEGNPTTYIPQTMYTVTVKSSQDFNGLLVTGLFSSSVIKTNIGENSLGVAISVGDVGHTIDSPHRPEFVCGIIYSGIFSPRTPRTQVTFYWTAPPVGTGCVKFLLTASLGTRLVFQDVVSFHICEGGQQGQKFRPSLAHIHSNGVIIRDDFEFGDILDLWSEDSNGVSSSDACGEITHGNAAVFCTADQNRQLVTPMLNLTKAVALQFTIGFGTCEPILGYVNVSYRSAGSSVWTTMRKIWVQETNQATDVWIPVVAQEPRTQLKFIQSSANYGDTGCWALDNIVVTSEEPLRASLFENMDSFDSGNWLFMPGATVKTGCMSQGNAMIFNSSSNDMGPTYAVTQDLNLFQGAPLIKITDAIIRGGNIAFGASGHDEQSPTYVFSGPGIRSYCTAIPGGLKEMAAISFVLSIGFGNCCISDVAETDVELYTLLEGKKRIIASFSQDSYGTPKEVSMPIPIGNRIEGAVLCLRQKSHGGEGLNEWAIASFSLIPSPAELNHFAQFAINMHCASMHAEARVNFEYSTDHGRNWHLLQEACFPETCKGQHWPYNSSYRTNMNEGWLMSTLPLPVAALGPHTRFRWYLVESGAGTTSWAIDSIYIGSDALCPKWCSGHGMCTPSGCRCRTGYSGVSCNATAYVLPTFLAVDFNSQESYMTSFEAAYGSEVGFACGLLGTGKAMVFKERGKRMLVTKEIDATNLRFLQFSILMGRHSTTGTCQPPNMPGDGVIVHYTINHGVFWHLLQVVPFDSPREVRVVSVPLPSAAATKGLQIRWLQPHEQAEGKAVWAVDDVSLARDLYKSIYSDAKTFERIYSTSVSFHTGELTHFCNRTNVLLFSPTHKQYSEDSRYAETQIMEVSAGYVLEADIIFDCNYETIPILGEDDTNHEIALEYSRDYGVTWSLVNKENLPGSTTSADFHPSTVYHISEFQKWTKITLPLPKNTWSPHLQLRVIQNGTARSLWALDNVYIGPACEMNCHNRGRCRNGHCICEYSGVGHSCRPREALAQGVDDQFEDLIQLQNAGWTVVGAEIATSKIDKSGCGPMPSVYYLHFNKDGIRKVVTPDLDTIQGGKLQFYIRIGGGNCGAPLDRANGILLQFSNDGGISWELLDELYYLDYPFPTYVHRTIPPSAMTSQTSFRLWQPRNSGADHEQWSLSELIVGQTKLSNESPDPEPLGISSRRSVQGHGNVGLVNLFIVASNNGQPEDFCNPKSDSYVFNKAKGNRFATTDDFKLETGSTIQFELNIGCQNEFSWSSPVRLEFSQDGGYSWDLVVRPCYPAGRPISQMVYTQNELAAYDCTGTARELKEGSVYYQGGFKEWRREVISVDSRVAAMPARFRWWQKVPFGTTPTSWAIRSVYIGQSCPLFCSGYGTCILSADFGNSCKCDERRTGENCEYSDYLASGFWDHVSTPNIPEKWWQIVLGTSDKEGCVVLDSGRPMYFGKEGTRVAQTTALDTTRVRLIQFYFRLGSIDEYPGCTVPQHRNEAVLLQYSNDNGITWILLKELSFNLYNSRSERIMLHIPPPAKTRSTTFRWWQPLGEKGNHRSQWAIDEIFIGVANLREQGFVDDFENGILDKIWYEIRGGTTGFFTVFNNTLKRPSNSLLVHSEEGGLAETWDFQLSSGSFLQFDLGMEYDGNKTDNAVLNVECSTDLGITWQPVLPICFPGSSIGCQHGLGSSLYSGLNNQWTRHTLPLPDALASATKIRFRWIQYYYGKRLSMWSIDNVYLGNGCPWMCGGHGRCWPTEDGSQDHCICDSDFVGIHCEHSTTLLHHMLDTFDHPWDSKERYALVHGREDVKMHDLTSVGIMVAGENLQMGKEGIRMLQTATLNTSNTKYIQFYICYKGAGRIPQSTIVLQCTSNNGITWSTIQMLSAASNEQDEKNFVHVILPRHCQQPAVSFRWWQANVGAASPLFAKNNEVWALENLAIGGHASGCDRHFLEDDFSYASSSLPELGNWLFHPGGNIGNFCSSPDEALVFEKQAGEHSVSTTDICISENYIIQFKIAIGCSDVYSSSHSIRLEFSTNHGVTWSLVRPHCHANTADPPGCSDELHPASIFYAGVYNKWRRVVIPLDRYHICSSVRFRWYQGFYSDDTDAAKAISWALDDVYIGPACNQMCNGHGVCSDHGGKCQCDPGYEGKTCCDIIKNNPILFQETFDHHDDKKQLMENGKWLKLAGGDVAFTSSSCNSKRAIGRWEFMADQSGERILETHDLDMRDGRFIQFYIKLNHKTKAMATVSSQANADAENLDDIRDLQKVSESLYIQFSTDGGLRWTLIEEFPFISTNFDQIQYIALYLPEAARANATRFRWWQPMQNGESRFGFILDEIVIGGQESVIDDDFNSITPSNWLQISGGLIRPDTDSSECCSVEYIQRDHCRILELGHQNSSEQACGTNFATTNGAHVVPGSFISFNLHMNCESTSDSCEAIELQYSSDLGHTWLPLILPCYPDDRGCNQHYQGSTFFSDVYLLSTSHELSRIILFLPEHSWSHATRFRWLQRRNLHSGSWAISNIYIGSQCPGACTGHGRCHDSECICDNGWMGVFCERPTADLPSELKDVFASRDSKFPERGFQSVFKRMVGGQIDKMCGQVGYDQALHFFKPCSRLLETVPLNTTRVEFVQFMFRTGCGVSPMQERNQGILVDYSENAGAVWHNLAELYYEDYNSKPGFVNIMLPLQAKTEGVQFRWWQPEHSGLNHNDWALDNLLIGGKHEETMLNDDFSVAEMIGPQGLWFDRGRTDMWEFYDNTEPGSFCGRNNVILAGTMPGLDATISTKDFSPKDGFIMQYTIVVLCEDVQVNHQPVHVQYSTDFGDTWKYLVGQCLPYNKDCFGRNVTQPSVHFISLNWRRKTIWIPSTLFGRPVRFRFHQVESDVVWALDRLFIGPACPGACSGHGDCIGVLQEDLFREGEVNYDNRKCLCDYGYEAPNCFLQVEHQQKHLKDDFNEGMRFGSWSVVEAEKIGRHCGLIVDGNTLSFDGVGPRQAETVDLDLRDAQFLKQDAIVGGDNKFCLPAKVKEDGILIDFSTDGGISWEVLHAMDYNSYNEAKPDYMPLPLKAKTNATRLRWWQPFVFIEKSGLVGMGADRGGWAIDNIYIGGNEVNPYEMQDDFDVQYDSLGKAGPLDEELYDFYPNGLVTFGRCIGDKSSHLAWPAGDPLSTGQSLTTRELIVTSGHMIQFKIKIGCGEHVCSREFPVKLEYREDPRYDDWRLVRPKCNPQSPPSPRCPPYVYHNPSIYSLNGDHGWARITIPLDIIYSGTTQFRWSQEGGAPELFSWAIDDLFIGEACPDHCSGHGKCTINQQCVCDDGYKGEACNKPIHRYIIPVFRDNFEQEFISEKRWLHLSGGFISPDGCGPLRPFGFSRSVYFGGCESRELVTREMDLERAWWVEYVIQVGSDNPTKECHMTAEGQYGIAPNSVVVLQYTVDNGVKWHTLREHSSLHYSVPRRVSQALPSHARSKITSLRWWQTTHTGEGKDQWALDNVNIGMSRRQRHLHLIDYQKLLRTPHEVVEIEPPSSASMMPSPTLIDDTETRSVEASVILPEGLP